MEQTKPTQIMDSRETEDSDSDDSWQILCLDFRNDILEDIFKHLEFTTLKQFRLVCKLWQKEALRVLADRALVSCYKGALVSLNSTLQSSHNAQYFFTSFDIKFTAPLNSLLRQILQNYGHFLKNLKCSGELCQLNGSSSLVPTYQGNNLMLFKSNRTIFIETYEQILKQWCPNLKSIRIFASVLSNLCPGDDLNSGGRIRQYFDKTQLNLTSLELDGYAISRHRNFCLEIIKSSKELKSLKIRFGWNGKKGWEKEPEALKFFQELKNLQEITTNLEEFAFIGLKLPGLLPAIRDIQFDPEKLKSLTVSGPWNISDPYFPHAIDFLEKLQDFENLEILKIYKCACLHCEWRNWKEKFRWRDIEADVPILESVRLLQISTFGSYGIGSLALLLKFPRMEELRFYSTDVGHSNNSLGGEDFDYFFQDWPWIKKGPIGRMILANAGRNLKILKVDHTLSKLESLECIRDAFPALKELSIGIQSGVKYCWEVYMEGKMSIPSAIQVLAGINGLEELNLKVDSKILYPHKETLRAMRVLKEMKKLRSFTLEMIKSPIARSENPRDLKSDVLSREHFLVNSLNIWIGGGASCGSRIEKEDRRELKGILLQFRKCYTFQWCCLTAQGLQEGNKYIHLLSDFGSL